MHVMGILDILHYMCSQKKWSDHECLLFCNLVTLQCSKGLQPQPFAWQEYGLEDNNGDVCIVVFDRAGRILFA